MTGLNGQEISTGGRKFRGLDSSKGRGFGRYGHLIVIGSLLLGTYFLSFSASLEQERCRFNEPTITSVGCSEAVRKDSKELSSESMRLFRVRRIALGGIKGEADGN